MKKESKYALIIWIIIIGFLFGFSTFKNVSFVEGSCPSEVYGNNQSLVSIKYFKSPYCVYCWFQEPILDNLVESKGALFSLAYYDVRHCKDEVYIYGIPGTPSFVFSIDGEESRAFGSITMDALEEVVCSMGGC